MSHKLHNSLVRIFTTDGNLARVSFLVAENLIPTCENNQICKSYFQGFLKVKRVD